MRTLLICHADDRLNRFGMARWLASVSELAGIVVIEESPTKILTRIRKEIGRSGFWRFWDILAFRIYYRLKLNRADEEWERDKLEELSRRYPGPASSIPLLVCASPNAPEVREFIRRAEPDLAIARCKVLLKEEIFRLPKVGTFVMHPGVCPEYRNAHGCFWALANRDLDHVGMTLLRVDRGVDTGPVYGYYSCAFDELGESHFVIQQRVVFDNLEVLAEKLRDICAGRAVPLDTSGRKSGVWGQPWLSRYLRWKREAARGRATR